MAGRQKWRQEGFDSRDEWTRENVARHQRGESDQWHDPALDIELPGPEVVGRGRVERARIKDALKAGTLTADEYAVALESRSAKPRTAKAVRRAAASYIMGLGSDGRVTLSELASALGYSSQAALMKAINDANLPADYREALDEAVNLADSMLTQRMLAIAEQKHDYKGYESALSRMDRLRESLDRDLRPAASVPGGTSSILALQVQIGKQDREQGTAMIEDRISALVRRPSASAGPEPVYVEYKAGGGDE